MVAAIAAGGIWGMGEGAEEAKRLNQLVEGLEGMGEKIMAEEEDA